MKHVLTISFYLMGAAGLIGLWQMLYDIKLGKMIDYKKQEQLPVLIVHSQAELVSLQPQVVYYYPTFSRGMAMPASVKLVYSNPVPVPTGYALVPVHAVVPAKNSVINLFAITDVENLLAAGIPYIAKGSGPGQKEKPRKQIDLSICRFGLRSKSVSIV